MNLESDADEVALTGHGLPEYLTHDVQIHVIISVLSGTQQALPYHESILSPFLTKHGIKHTTHTTESAQTIIELVKSRFLPQACRGTRQTIILLSGDGGLIDLINTLAGGDHRTDTFDAPQSRTISSYVKPVVCLFPQGTANALAWSSKIATDPLEIMLHGQPTPLPMFRATFSSGAKLVTNEGTELESIDTAGHTGSDEEKPQIHGAVVFSWGLHASLVARTDTREYRKHGIERFGMAAGDLLKENHAYRGTIKIKPSNNSTSTSVNEDREWQVVNIMDSSSSSSPSEKTNHTKDQSPPQALSYLAATMVSNFEEKYTISPSHQPLSNTMYLIYIAHRPSNEISELAFLPYKDGQHVNDPRVLYQAIDALRIELDDNHHDDDDQHREICIDGKIVRLERGGWAQVERLQGASVVDVVGKVSS